jgi:hypothetical protein
VFASIIIITIISITPIIILGLGEITAGQRDVLLSSGSGTINASKVGELSGQAAMPRISEIVKINGASSVGWFMDLKLEREQHLGTLQLGNDVGNGEEPIYVHGQFKVGVG